jgi:hypothetical protein
MSEVEDRVKGLTKRTGLLIPPYGRELTAARRRRESPSVFIHAGERAWDRAKLRAPPEVLCLPPDADFRAYDWSILKNLGVTLVVWDREATWVDDFAQHLVRSGAELVCALNSYRGEGEKIESVFYRMRPK